MAIIGLLSGQNVQATIFAKQLKKEGHKTILFCENKHFHGCYTRYADERVKCPSASTEPQQFNDFFLDYLEHNALDVVVPLNDDTAKYLSKNKSTLLKKVKYSIPDFSVFMNAYDKNQLMKSCELIGVPHPISIDLSTLKKGDIVAGFKFPAIIKPNETFGALGFTKVTDFKDMWNHYDTVFETYGNCHLQEYISHEGMQYKVDLMMHDSKTVNAAVFEKQRFYPVSGGSSCFNKSIDNDHLVAICTKVLQHIKWEGFADFDLIEDPRDGIIKIMEINPRVPNCLKSCVTSGIDIPNAIVDLSLHKPLKLYTYTSGKYLRFFTIDLVWLLSSKHLLTNFKVWIKHLFSKNHYSQDFEFLDPVPFLIGSFYGLKKIVFPKLRSKRNGMKELE